MEANKLLAQLQELEGQKSEAISALLKETKELEASTKLRIQQIAADLKALGYKRPRKPAKKAA